MNKIHPQMPENSRVWSVCYVGHVTRGDLLEIWVNSFFFLSFSAFPRFSRTCTSKQHVMIVSFNCDLKGDLLAFLPLSRESLEPFTLPSPG